MSDRSDSRVDATDADHRLLGSGLFEEEMGPGSSLGHLYRAEMDRTTVWRQRLDRTTNWAVIVVAAVLTWSFSSPTNPHYVLLVGAVALYVFLFVEARRFQGYEMWRSRVRTLQRNVWAYGLDPASGVADPDWRVTLGRSYREPKMHVGVEEAVAHRLRRVYLFLLGVVVFAWVLRTTVFAPGPWPASATIGAVPGSVVVVAVGLCYTLALVVALRPRTWSGHTELH